MTPADLIDVSNNPIMLGPLTATAYPSMTAFTAPDLEEPMEISGSLTYIMGSQFFNLTDQADSNGNPYWYCQDIPVGVASVTISDMSGNSVPIIDYTIRQVYRDGTLHNYVLHSLNGEPYFIKYIGTNGMLQTVLLQYQPVIQRSTLANSSLAYTLTGSILEVSDTSTFWIMFNNYGGFEVLEPYGDLPNDSWYVRINYPLNPMPIEYGNQLFDPQLPYMFASWVPGTVITSNVIQFERKNMFYDGIHNPDVLVYDQNYNLKYALAGSSDLGYEFPWKRNQYASIEPWSATIETLPALEATDFAFGFYCYAEYNILYSDLDVNPFTNPQIRECEISFIYNPYGPLANRNIYHLATNPATGQQISPIGYNPMEWNGSSNSGPQVFGYVVPGTEVSTGNYTITDARVRGGGLAPAFQTIPQAKNFWDLGYWDGKPYPLGGGLIVYLPESTTSVFTPQQVLGKVQAIVPMGVLPVIRYVDQEGNESNE
jgi:hypothetical protein